MPPLRQGFFFCVESLCSGIFNGNTVGHTVEGVNIAPFLKNVKIVAYKIA